LRAGTSCFCCPLCRDKELFHKKMLTTGIQIPRRLPAWESLEAFAGLGERHGRCDASECLCPERREQAEEEGPWELLLCSSCVPEGTHWCCSQLGDNMASWECGTCTGPSTSKRQSTWVPLGWWPGSG
ncbi:PHF7 protein, partial [Brachypteracias leptosomus]|nr:PHF7 protein [Brachypteracias leptosomus]